ncbi:MAG: hypothetical protein IJW23_00840 [Lentisphaeria bacterium]|nr:hypothetical protein [Lentisphaeria bacterium]
MKRASLILSAFAVCSALFAEEFHPGGPSLDFRNISEKRFSRNTQGNGNLFKDWKPGAVFLHSSEPGSQKFRSKAVPLIKFTKTPVKGGFILKTEKPSAIADVAGKYAKSISASWTQRVILPDNKGGEYRMTFRSRVQPYAGPGATNGLIIAVAKTEKGTGKTIVKYFPGSAKTFRNNEISLQFPDGTRYVDFFLRLDGCGLLEAEMPVLEKVKHQYPVEATLFPNGKLDNVYVLSQKDPAIIPFVLKRNVPKSELKLTSPVLEVTLPKEVEFLDVSHPLKFITKSGNTYYFDASFWKPRLLRYDGYESYLKLAILVTTKAAPGDYSEPIRFKMTDSGTVISEPSEFHFKVIPQIKPVAKSSLFLTGYHPMGLYLNFSKLESRKLFAKFSGDTGFRWIAHNFDPETTKWYRKYGTEMITPELYWLANGYRICQTKPDYAKFKPIGKTASFDVNNATCPAAIYNKTEFYYNTFIPYIQSNLEGKDGVLSNWEPYMFHGQGCYCNTCRDEFADYMKIPRAEMKKLWPKELTVTGRYYKQGVRFRSLQHAKLVKTIQETIKKYTSGKAGFVPEVVWITCADTTERHEGSSAEHDPMDYADSLTYFNAWGPYTGWKALEPHSYEKGENLNAYIAAKRVSAFMKQRFGEKCPRLQALPHGLQGNFWVTSPEGMAMEVTGFFVQGFRSALIYLYPQGYDARYWKVLAENNDLIAQNEDFVVNGKRVTDSVSAEAVTPFPAPKKRIQPRYLVNPPPESLLQIEAFRKGNATVAAVGNFWSKGDVFFKLKVRGLKPSAVYAVTEPAKKRTFVADNGKFFTGAQLKDGVLLHAGALKWVFFRIEPVSAEAAQLKKIAPAHVKKAMNAHLPAIRKAAAEDAVLDAATEAEYKKSELRTLVAGPLKCTPAVGKNGQRLVFTSGKSSLSFDLHHCVIRDWNVDGTLWTPAFGVPSFWLPAHSGEALYQVVKQDITPDGILVTAEKLFNRKISPKLEHLKVRHSILVSRDLRTVKISTILIDAHNSETGGGGFTLGFRYQSFPANMGAKDGSILMTQNGKTYTYKRNLKRMVFSVGKTDSGMKMKKLFACTEDPVVIDNGTVILRNPASADQVTIKAYPEKLFAGYAVWDTPQHQVPTFEPFFHPVTIRNGEQAAFSIELRAGKK